MKNTKTTVTSSFNFAPVREALIGSYNAGVSLANALVAVWNSVPQEKRVVSTFRKEFMAFALAEGYGETWIKRTLASVDELRVRGKRSDADKARKSPAKKKAKTVQDIVAEIRAMKLGKQDLKNLMAELAKLA